MDLSRIADIAEIVGALFVIGGMLFAIVQIRQYRQQRRELAAIELFRSFGNPQFAEAYRSILNLPEGLDTNDLSSRYPGIEDSAMLIATTMENIGVMTYERIVPFSVVNHLVGDSTLLLWKRLERWVADARESLDSEYAFEWFEWLADRLDEHGGEDVGPAYVARRNWRPARQSREL